MQPAASVSCGCPICTPVCMRLPRPTTWVWALLCAGLALLDGGLLTAIKMLLVWLLVLAASAAAAHMIAQQALRQADK